MAALAGASGDITALFSDAQVERLARAMETGADRRIDRREYENAIPRPSDGVS